MLEARNVQIFGINLPETRYNRKSGWFFNTRYLRKKMDDFKKTS